jgi:BASS family bile acid:Na+ symporter
LLLRLLKSRDLVLILALGLGLAWDDPARYTHRAVLPLLALIMTLSLLGVSTAELRSPARLWSASWRGLLLNYLALSGLVVLLAWLAPLSPEHRQGFLLIAAAPPAVAVIPFTEVLRGDRAFSLLALTGCYLAALAVMPAMFLLFWEVGVFDHWRLVQVLLLLVAAPLAASRLILAAGWGPALEPLRGVVTNWSFFVVCYSIVGLNAPAILSHPGVLAPIALVVGCASLVWGAALELGAAWAGVPAARRASLVLLATLKNYGLAGGLALELLGGPASLPAVVSVVAMFLHLLWLSLLRRRTAGRGG